MDKPQILLAFEALSASARLDAYRLLVGAGHDGMVAGDIASALDIAPSNLSFHLKTLTQAGLIGVEQEGRYQRYRANIPAMLQVVDFLTSNCCGGHPERCVEARPTCGDGDCSSPVEPSHPTNK
ncbi:helix-turn-helix transcriptional regulator [Chitinivorax sp. PXF-14]|uniref:ArsR/SmtB family transcription factor n=1 Tax=Chitinivorax sp. PXF-14 TaxID=3230488 RepID=UPI003467E87E